MHVYSALYTYVNTKTFIVNFFSYMSKVLQHLPFLITRSKFGNLPVYINYKKGRTRIITKIRNVRGDIEVLFCHVFVVCCIRVIIESHKTVGRFVPCYSHLYKYFILLLIFILQLSKCFL